jgi:hypothetical protein
VSDLSFVQVSAIHLSSFTIQAVSAGAYELGLIGSTACPDGIMTLTTENRVLAFSNDNPEPWDLPPDSDKCVLLMNTANTTISVAIQFMSDMDYLYYYSGQHNPQRYTGIGNATFVKSRSTRPVFFRIHSSNYLISRSVEFRFTTNGGREGNRTLFWGRINEAVPTPWPIPAPGQQWVSGIDLAEGLMVMSSSVAFVLLLAFASCRYQWCSCGKVKLSAHQWNVGYEEARPPSSFVESYLAVGVN